MASLAPKVRMVVGAYQILQQMHGVLDIEYPPMVKEALRWFEFVNLDGFRIFPSECLEQWQTRGYTAYYLKARTNNLIAGCYISLLVVSCGVGGSSILRPSLIEGGQKRGFALGLAGVTFYVVLAYGSQLAALMDATAEMLLPFFVFAFFALCPPARRLLSPAVNILLSLPFTLDVLFLIQVPRSAAIASKLACKHFDDSSALSPPSMYQMPCLEQLDFLDWFCGVAFYPVRAMTKCSHFPPLPLFTHLPPCVDRHHPLLLRVSGQIGSTAKRATGAAAAAAATAAAPLCGEDDPADVAE
jgi:hypothetical protein